MSFVKVVSHIELLDESVCVLLFFDGKANSMELFTIYYETVRFAVNFMFMNIFCLFRCIAH